MVVTIRAETDKELIQRATLFSELPRECGSCGSKDLSLKFRSPQGYEFYQLVCNRCDLEFKISQSKQEHGLLFINHSEAEWKDRAAYMDKQSNQNRNSGDDAREYM